jgi:type 1 fimbria pilin
MLSPLILRLMPRKKCFLPLLLVSPLALAQPCTSTNNCKIDVQFKGMYLENTCDLSINNGSQNETVALPVISTATLNHNGSEAGSELFSITLSNCPTNKVITLYFASTASGADSATGNLLNSTGDNYAKNVEIRLRKSDTQQQMVIDNADSSQNYDVISTDDITHQFIASYYASDNNGAGTGLVNTAAAIVIDYK